MGIYQKPIATNTSSFSFFGFKNAAKKERDFAELKNEIEAIHATQAVVHYSPDGFILDANAMFLKLMGYTQAELIGKHHRLFMLPEQVRTEKYATFWSSLNKGEAQQSAFQRLDKNGKEIWLRSSYIPVRDSFGTVVKIVQLAVDITWQVLKNYDYEGQVKAIRSQQAVAEFDTDGTLIDANQTYLNTLDYTLEEIKGKHHSFLIDKDTEASADYQNFWSKLAEGEACFGEYRQSSKDGKETWLQASYTPFLDHRGRVQKVVMYGMDITLQKLANVDFKAQIDGINSSQAVIQYTPDGIILDANSLFLKSLGYSLRDLKGEHHRIFVRPDLRFVPVYLQFWEALARGEPQSGEYRHIGKNNTHLWIQATYVPIRNSRGEVQKIVEYCTDITQQKETQLEVARLITCAMAGELSERASLDNTSGDSRKMREDINKMLDSFTKPLQEISKVMRELANNNLTESISGSYQGELGELKEFVNTALVQLRESLGKVRDAANIVKNSAREISSGNAELSSRTESQASTLEETAASMEEMTATVQQTASNARLANQLAVAAKTSAEEGGNVVTKAVNAMNGISESSQKISKIIEVIESLAFQTNLLALNASVEAARAGDQGRGFAVVADEVRQLAGRSSGAAKEIKELINESTRKVKEGSTLVNNSGEMLNQISTAVQKVSSVISEIMSAASEQADGISSVNDAVQQMDDMTQKNSTLVEEAASNSEELGNQSDFLSSMMDSFKI